MKDFLINYSTYIAVAAGLLAGVPAIRRMKPAGQAPLSRDIAMCLLYAVLSVISVLVFASVEELIKSGEFQIGAVSTYGLYLIAPFIMMAVFRKDRADRFDELAVYAMPSLFLQRIRCLIAGCCYGTHMFGGDLRWPVREAELIFYAVMLVVLIRGARSGRMARGSLFPLLMVCYGSLRFILEFFRANNGAGLFHLPHIWSMLTIVAGLSVLLEIKRRSASLERKRAHKAGRK